MESIIIIAKATFPDNENELLVEYEFSPYITGDMSTDEEMNKILTTSLNEQLGPDWAFNRDYIHHGAGMYALMKKVKI